MELQIQLRGANCPDCFERVTTMLRDTPGVAAVHGAFSSHCLRVDLGSMSVDQLMALLRANLHGIAVAGNGDRVMVEVEPAIGAWHCH
jgi:hypothetical protein